MVAVQAEEVTVTFSEQGYANTQEVTELVINNYLTATFSPGENTTTPKYYNTGSAFRLYAKNTMTITGANNATINSITLTTGSGDNVVNAGSTVSAGTLAIDGTTATITDIEANSVTFTQGGSKGHVRIVSMTIDYTIPATGATLEPIEASVASGTLYNTTSVELTHDAEIHYTLDGTEPTAESPVYSGAISISEFGTTTTIKAIAIDGEEYSDIATFTYSLKVAAPVFSVEGGVYEKLSLSLTSETTGAKFFYNDRDGDPITESSTFYGNLSILSTKTIKAVAYVVNAEGDKIYSEVTSEHYIISPIKPFELATTITDGKYAIGANDIVADHFNKTSNYGYLYTVAGAVKNEKFIETNEFYGYTFTQTGTAGEFYIQDAYDRYLYLTGTYNSFNVKADNSELGDGAIWKISIAEDGTATIVNKEKSKTLAYSTQYKSFGAYPELESTHILPKLYAPIEYPTLTFTPGNYDEVDKITTITVYCEKGITLNESDELFAYYRIGWDYTNYDLGYGQVSADGKTVTYTLDTPIESNETYKFTFPAGLFTMYPGGLDVANSSTTINVTVDNPNILELTNANPGNNSYVNSIEYLSFEYSSNIFDNGCAGAVITDDKGNEYPLSVTYEDAYGATPYNMLCLKTAEPITAPGTYTFVLKKEYAYNDANAYLDEDITYTFYIKDKPKIISVSPVEGTATSSINEIILTFNMPITHDYFFGISVFDSNYSQSYEFMKDANTDYETETIRLTCDTPITEAGTYSFMLSSYSVCDANYEYNDEAEFSFTFDGSSIITGIDGIEADGEGREIIFDLTGRQVKEITAPGIYIINGVKTLVK